ncbi:MAG: hypothetical protein AAGD07_08365 [Planctomycetota bacterium]
MLFPLRQHRHASSLPLDHHRSARWSPGGILSQRLLLLSWTLAFWALSAMVTVNACPFCSAVQQTLRQEMELMDAVVIAEAMQSDLTRNPDTGEVRMRVVTVLRGSEHIQSGQEVEAVYFGAVKLGRRYLLNGVDPEDLQWSCLPLSERSEQYVKEVATKSGLPGAERLRFYQEYLEDPDSMLSRDAYDEFASAPYEDVQDLKPHMDHAQLLAWLEDAEMSADRRRLYLTMLGVCGTKDDLPFLESLLQSTQKSARSGLDALIACYLTLAGEEGLPMVNKLFMENQQASYADTYAAIMAIRFHGTEGGVIARSALVESLHSILERSDLADLVIPDLARWEDWSQVEKVRELFLEADPANNWIRVPAVNYLRACPLDRAAAIIEELKGVDPDSVKRASTFFSIPKPSPAKAETSAVMTSGYDKAVPGERYAASRASIEENAEVPLAAIVTEEPSSPELATPMGAVSLSMNHLGVGIVLGLTLLIGVVAQMLVLTGGPWRRVAVPTAAETTSVSQRH